MAGLPPIFTMLAHLARLVNESPRSAALLQRNVLCEKDGIVGPEVLEGGCTGYFSLSPEPALPAMKGLVRSLFLWGKRRAEAALPLTTGGTYI